MNNTTSIKKEEISKLDGTSPTIPLNANQTHPSSPEKPKTENRCSSPKNKVINTNPIPTSTPAPSTNATSNSNYMTENIRKPYDYFSTRIPRSQIETKLKIVKDERFLFFIKYGTLRRFDGDCEIIYVEIPQIPNKLVIYRRPCARMKSIEKFNLSKKDLPHIPLFEGEENLQYLSLEMNQITRIDQLISLNSLVYLNLYCNKISEIENLHNTPKLKVLLLGKNNIDKIKNLHFLHELEILDLHSNRIKVIENLIQLKKLKILNIANNQIPNLNELLFNRNLEELNIRKNCISSLPSLAGNWEKMRKLNLGKNLINKVEYLSELKKLKNLNELILEDNPVLLIKESVNYIKSLPIMPSKNHPFGNANMTTQNPITLSKKSPVVINCANPNMKLSEPNGNNNNIINNGNDINNSSHMNIGPKSLSASMNNPNNINNSNGIINSNILISTKNPNMTTMIQSKLNGANFLYNNNNVNNSNTNVSASSLLLNQNNKNIMNSTESVNFIDYNCNKSNSTNYNANISQTTNSVSCSNSIKYMPPQIIKQKDELNEAQSLAITKPIKAKWEEEIKKITMLGLNGYLGKRYKEHNIVTGHVEMEGDNKLILYGDAIKVLLIDDFQKNITSILFNYFYYDIIINRKTIEIFKSFKKLNTLSFSNNNIYTFYQLIKLENLNSLENISINNNEVCNSNLLKYFLIYRIQNLKIFNGKTIKEEDVNNAKHIFEYFDNCISINEKIKEESSNQCKEEKKINENTVTVESTEKCDEGNDNKEDKSMMIYKRKFKYMEFIKNNLDVILKEIVNEMNNE